MVEQQNTGAALHIPDHVCIATEVRNPDYYLCDYRRDGAIASTGSTQQQNTVQQVLSSFALLDSAGRKKVLLMEVKDFELLSSPSHAFKFLVLV